jgi:hypothetical protein
MQNQSQFIHFLIEAKRQTYAAGGEHSAPSRPHSRDLRYENGDYAYIDTYLGDLDFIGEEAVWLRGSPIWSMNYYGYLLTDDLPEGFIHCLKGALLLVPEEAPYRGPASYTEGSLEYRCAWQGDMDCYEGKECILSDGQEIYRLVFHGGRVREAVPA